MVCRVGFGPTNRNGAVLQTVCFDRLHTGTYKEALSLVVLPAGIEPATHRASTYCSTNWATEADGDPWGIRIPNLLREREMT